VDGLLLLEERVVDGSLYSSAVGNYLEMMGCQEYSVASVMSPNVFSAYGDRVNCTNGVAVYIVVDVYVVQDVLVVVDAFIVVVGGVVVEAR
jgi:hypothetical protein